LASVPEDWKPERKVDWKARAAAVSPPIPANFLDRVVPAMETLDDAFQRVREQIIMDELAWDGPDCE